MKYGFNEHRLESNPAEKIYLELANQNFIDCNAKGLSQIVNRRGFNNTLDTLDDEEETIVLSILQWLGSPVGQSFIEDAQQKISKLKL